MLRFLLRRVTAAVVLLLVVVSAVFALLHLAPGSPLNLITDPRVSEQQIARLEQLYGLDRSLPEQYLRWLSAVVLRGDWGTSFVFRRPVAEVIAATLPNTLLLGSAALVVGYGLGLFLGVAAAARAGGVLDRTIRVVSLGLYSAPGFWLALILIEVLAVRLGLFPINQMHDAGAESLPLGSRLLDLLHHLALPAVTLGLALCGSVVRLVRNSMLDILGQDFIRTARAKGLSERQVLWRHALPNALGPWIQRLGLSLPGLFGGALIVEIIFSWPGLGQVTFTAIQGRDYPLVLATTTLSGILVVLGSLGADLLHAWVDPRVRRDA